MSVNPAAVAFLDLPIENGMVQLRTGPRRINDIDEFAAFIRSLYIHPLEFFRTSNVNLSWRVRLCEKDGVFSLGPKLVGDACLPDDLAKESGYLSAMKFIQASSLSRLARRDGIPAPYISNAGTNGIDRPWCLQEFARGQEATEMTSPDSRLAVAHAARRADGSPASHEDDLH